MSEWKPAKKAYTKAQKRQRSEIREEFEWTMEIPVKRPHLIESFGVWRWIEQLMELNNRYREASDGRDELMNNHMLLFATFQPELFDKITNNPKDLTNKERAQAETLLKAAMKEGQGVI